MAERTRKEEEETLKSYIAEIESLQKEMNTENEGLEKKLREH